LVEITRRISIQCVKQTRHAVKKRARPRVEGHVVKGCESEEDSEIPCEQAIC
jgi:hypothetical protein